MSETDSLLSESVLDKPSTPPRFKNPAVTSPSASWNYSGEGDKLAFYRRLGTREVLDVMMRALGCCEAGFSFTSIFGFMISMGRISNWPLWILFVPLWLGQLVALLLQIYAFALLKRFLYGRQPVAVRTSTSQGLALSKREKLPFARAFVMLSVKVLVVSVLLLAFSILVFCKVGTRVDVPLSLALSPLIVLAALFLVTALLCKGGSTVKTLLWTAVLVQVVLLLLKTDDDWNVSWVVIGLPVMVGGGLLELFIGFRILRTYRFTCAPAEQAHAIKDKGLNESQLTTAWFYFIGIAAAFGSAVIVFSNLQQASIRGAPLDTKAGDRAVGAVSQNFATILFIVAEVCLAWAIYRMAADEARAFVDFTGEVAPLPLHRNLRGEWDVDEDKVEDSTDDHIFGPSVHRGTVEAELVT